MVKKDIYIILGKRIKEERIKLNMTQEELSERVNLNPKSISFLERGCGAPSFDTFVNIAEVLNVSLDGLIIRNKNQKENSKYILQVKYLFSDLSDKQQEKLVDVIKTAKKLIK